MAPCRVLTTSSILKCVFSLRKCVSEPPPDTKHTKPNESNHQPAFCLARFPRIKQEGLCSTPNPIQPLPAPAASAVVAAAAVAAVAAAAAAVAADAADAAAAAAVPAVAVLLVPLVLLRHLHVPASSNRRIGIELPLFPGSKGYADAPYRPERPVFSLVAASVRTTPGPVSYTHLTLPTKA